MGLFDYISRQFENYHNKIIKPFADTINNRISLLSSRYNVLAYGLVKDGQTDNSTVLTQMLAAIPEGAVVYFPQGTYKFLSPIEITKNVSLVGDSSKIQKSSSSNKNHPDTQLIFESKTAEQSFLTLNNAHLCVSNLTFHSNSYIVAENKDAFTQLPYSYFKETSNKTNINCIDAINDKGHDVIIRDCSFVGFSGFAVAVQQHKYIKNCGFKYCNIGIVTNYTDNIIDNCWFTSGNIAIEHRSKGLLKVSNAWCDMMCGHFIHATKSAVLLVNDVWVDMIDGAGIYVEDNLQNSMINGRFSRCGMQYSGLAETDRTSDKYPYADVITARQIHQSDINITVQKREITLGGQKAICPSRIISSWYSSPMVKECRITCVDSTIADICGNDTYYYDTDIIGIDKTVLKETNWEYQHSPIQFRETSPIGKVVPRKKDLLCVDETTGNWYISTTPTSTSDKNAWKLLTSGSGSSSGSTGDIEFEAVDPQTLLDYYTSCKDTQKGR